MYSIAYNLVVERYTLVIFFFLFLRGEKRQGACIKWVENLGYKRRGRTARKGKGLFIYAVLYFPIVFIAHIKKNTIKTQRMAPNLIVYANYSIEFC